MLSSSSQAKLRVDGDNVWIDVPASTGSAIRVLRVESQMRQWRIGRIKW